jgi:sugar lactone lactonase YvrE
MTDRIPDWRIVSDRSDRLGESPLWHAGEAALYWIDFYGPTVHRLDPATGRRRDWTIAGFQTIGSLALCEGGRLLLALDQGLFLFDPAGGTVTPFADPNQGRAGIGYNDAKVDRQGRYWVGTFDAAETAPRGILHRVAADGSSDVGDSGFVVCNGPAFSPDGRVLYFNDTLGRRTLAYDLDPATGALSGRRDFHVFGEADGYTDGLCTDREGHVWCAFYAGGKVVRMTPAGEVVETLRLPVPNVTACCLGGPELRTLYVTTGITGDGLAQDGGGSLFALDVAVPGLPEPVFGPR